MNQRFYIRNYGDNRWYVFMGNKAMDEVGAGVLVAETGHQEAAEYTAQEYTRIFNQIVNEDVGNGAVKTTPEPQQRY